MWIKSPIFRKLLFSAFSILVLGLLILDFYLGRYTTRHEIEREQQRLEVSGQILSGEAEAVAPAELQAWAHRASARAQARITVISPTGVVLADSQHDPETMENHAQRPEIVAAYRGQIGKSIRRSAALGLDMCYLAVPLTYRGQPQFVLRLALPLEDLHAAVAPVRRRILAASLLVFVTALLLAYLFSRSFTRRITRLKEFAEGLPEARSWESPFPPGDDELVLLANAFKRTGARLRDAVDRLSLESAQREAILASMVEGVLAVDGDLRITFCNASFLRLIGPGTDDRRQIPEGVPVIEVIRDPALTDLLSRVLAQGGSLKQRLRLPTEGHWFEVQVSRLAAPSRGGAIAILHDVTDLERLERVRKDFVANVSHELRTPLTAIRGCAETLLEGALEDKENNRRFLEIIRAQAVRLDNIASDLLVLSELESGKPAAAPERVSVAAAIEVALRAVESEARDREVRLVRGNLEEVEVLGHRTRLEQGLVNLLDNAVKFNRPGGEVRVEATFSTDGRVRIGISDTGIGIPSQDLSRIFERFYRVDKARSREVGGTGLGLSIVKHIVERMDGTISVESRLGEGSTFAIHLPVAAA
jgi:two-component system, OmpR family, phosphate regulon sensor histidine kinase PhoR